MRWLLVLVAVLMIGRGGSLQAAADADAARGEVLYRACAACHGERAGGMRAQSAPRLNHLRETYIVAQLEKFRAGLRGAERESQASRSMAAAAATLPDQRALLDVAAYAAALRGEPSAVTVVGDSTLGADYFNQLCGACHGPQAAGNAALNSPALAGSDDWYLLAQLEAFRSGARGAHPEDRTGRQMRAMAMALPSATAINDVVAFIRSLADAPH